MNLYFIISEGIEGGFEEGKVQTAAGLGAALGRAEEGDGPEGCVRPGAAGRGFGVAFGAGRPLPGGFGEEAAGPSPFYSCEQKAAPAPASRPAAPLPKAPKAWAGGPGISPRPGPARD